ncbi:MAG TPA: hypothetical protein ENJ18_11650 [Nannocystis exedens]|nr:hypothetical protein [Nannocystis exedens]
MLAHTAHTFDRWCQLALPRAFAVKPPDSATILRHWHRARHNIAARFALACAREAMIPADLSGNAVILRADNRSITIPLARIGEFGLHSPDLRAAIEPVAADPEALLKLLAPAIGLGSADTERLRIELCDSAKNLALTTLSAALRDDAAASGRPWPAPIDPENLVVEGHPWHPMCKTRLRLGLAQVLRHAPEHLALGCIRAVDVDRDLVQLQGSAEDLLRRLFVPGPSDMIRLPVHQAQLRRLPALFPDLWGTRIRPAKVEALDGRALLSLRTVALDGHNLQIKLALDAVMTSARRTVSPMSVANGPPLTTLLQGIAKRDADARGLLLLGDRAAAGLRADSLGERAPQLGVIIRSSPEKLVRDMTGKTAETWVCAALGERRPAAERTLLCELAERHGSAEALIRRYIQLLLPPSLHLLSAYGIALELHLQNTLAIVGHSGLCGFVIRDLGGIRIHPGRLRAAGLFLSLAPDSFLFADDIDEVRDKLSHTLLHAHLGSLLRWAERDLGLPATRTWPLVRATIQATSERIAQTPSRQLAALADRDALLRPRCRAKALLRMRCEQKISDYAYTTVDNILADADVITAARRITIEPHAPLS